MVLISVQIGNLVREMKTIEKNKMKTLEQKYNNKWKIYHMGLTEDWTWQMGVSELEYRPVKNI